MKNRLKAIGIDALGILLLIGAAAFGWLPGPGGVPLLLGGLGLLSIRHMWAKNLLHRIKNSSTAIYEVFFPNHKIVHAMYDLLSISIVLAALYLLQHTTKNLLETMAIAALCVAVGLFMTNRRRLERITRWVAKKRRKA